MKFCPAVGSILALLLALGVARGARPPRGYCAPLSRALSSSSRCRGQLATSQPARGPREELVYVRLETTGASLAELSTAAINERLLVGLFARLLEPNDTETKRHSDELEVRAQLLEPANAKCRAALERLVCRLAYPSCHFRRADVVALVRPPCREDCLLLRDVLCANLNWSKFSIVFARALNSTLQSAISKLALATQPSSADEERDWSPWSAAKGYNLASQQVDATSRGGGGGGGGSSQAASVHYYWPHERSIGHCESLPPLSWLAGAKLDRRRARAAAHLGWPICSSAGLSRPSVALNASSPGGECARLPDGSDYAGLKNWTLTGRPCQPWSQQKPHQHSSSELLFDNMRGAHNYCRNPGATELHPWCYTMDANVRWEYCQVDQC